MNALQALRHVDLDWAMGFHDVWRTSALDIPDLHASLRHEFAMKLDAMERGDGVRSPLGWVVAGAGGVGKTHLLGAFRRETNRRGYPFIMVDMTDVRDFWDCVLQGYVDSLQAEIDGGDPQYKLVINHIIKRLGSNQPVAEALAALAQRKSRDLREDMNKALAILHQAWPRETLKYQDVIRALICVNSEDLNHTSLGQTWLRGTEIDEERRRELGLAVRGEQPRKIIGGLSWLLSLGGPAVLAFDQFDASIGQLHNRALGPDDDETTARAKAILTEIGGGLGALRDATRNTLTVVSCVEMTWTHLRDVILGTFLDRFEDPWTLSAMSDGLIAKSLITQRLDAAYRESGFAPPYSTYPFHPRVFEGLRSANPRELLKHCKKHIQKCLRDGATSELVAFGQPGENGGPVVIETEGLEHLDAEFQKLRAEANPDWLLEERYDDERLAPLILSGLRSLVEENEFGPNVTARIDAELTGGAKTRPLHARLRLIHHNLDEREEHFCVRAIQWSSATAFQPRLKGALTQSGIDRDLDFRRLAIIRSLPNPGGVATKRLIDAFDRHGGVFIAPTEDELRTLFALHRLASNKDLDIPRWLKSRRPASSLNLIQKIVGAHPVFQASAATTDPKPIHQPTNAPPAVEGAPTNEGGAGTPVTTPVVKTPPRKPIEPTAPVSSDGRIPLGRRLQGGKPMEEVRLPIELLAKHTFIVAGSGSGKTVLLKRLIEEAAIERIPTVVIDGANDIVALGDSWDEPPASWTNEDHRKANAYHASDRVVVWTPGRESGNPISMDPVPDLTELADDREELQAAVSMLIETLGPRVAKGSSQSNPHKLAILNNSLLYMAKHGGGRLNELIELLGDLPPEAGLGIANETRLASAMADDLRAARVLDPLLRSTGAPLDPAALFGSDDPERPARVSVISLIGLPGLEAQRNFLNQLTIALFSWLKKNPHYAGRPLRGLLVIDEAREFAPSQRYSACGEGLVRLTLQVRKFGLGLIFATQNPKDIHTKIVGSCSSHFYGKMNAPAALDAAREMIKLKGGSGDDLPRLGAGEFYFHNAEADITRVTKIQIPMCLSKHPRTPLDEATILEKAAASRDSLSTGAPVS